MTTIKASSLTDASGTIVSAGVAQALLDTNPAREGWRLYNLGTEPLWFNDTGGVAAPNAPGSYRVGPGDLYEAPAGISPAYRISLYGAQAGAPFSAAEW